VSRVKRTGRWTQALYGGTAVLSWKLFLGYVPASGKSFPVGTSLPQVWGLYGGTAVLSWKLFLGHVPASGKSFPVWTPVPQGGCLCGTAVLSWKLFLGHVPASGKSFPVWTPVPQVRGLYVGQLSSAGSSFWAMCQRQVKASRCGHRSHRCGACMWDSCPQLEALLGLCASVR